MKASLVETFLKRRNPGKKIEQYFIVREDGERTRFYATDDSSAYEFACKNWESGLRIYKNCGGGIFLGETR